MWVKPSQTEYKNIMEALAVIPFMPTFLFWSWSTTSFIQKFEKTQTILRVSTDFGDKLCTSDLFNDVTFITAINFDLKTSDKCKDHEQLFHLA